MLANIETGLGAWRIAFTGGKLAVVCALCPVLAFLQTGCATSEQIRHKPLPLPPSEEVRANLGTIGLVITRISTNKPIASPPSGGEAVGGGAGFGALEGFISGLQAGPLAIFVWPIVVPVGAVVGGIEGAGRAVPRAEVRQAEEQMRTTMHQMNLQEGVQRKSARAAREKTSHPMLLVTNVEGSGPGVR